MQTRNHQRGMVLTVALIFMLIISIITLSTMQNRTLEQRISVNAQRRADAFQVAESGLAAAMATDLSGAWQGLVNQITATNQPPETDLGLMNFGDGEAAIKIRYLSECRQLILGESLGSEHQKTPHCFEIESRGKLGNAASTHTQGLRQNLL